MLANDGALPLRSDVGRVAVVGPNADDPMALFGNYSFHSHVASFHPDEPLPEVETVLGALQRRLGPERFEEFRAIHADYPAILWHEFSVQRDLRRHLTESGRFSVAARARNRYGYGYERLEPR